MFKHPATFESNHMSHFSVLVIGTYVDAFLQPFHEFECTGTSDQFVQDVDITDECRTEHAEHTETKCKGPDGTLHDFFDSKGEWVPKFSKLREGTSAALNSRTYHVPEGYEKVEVPTSETFVEWLSSYHNTETIPFGETPDLQGEHKYGYALLNEAGEVTKVVDRTNPNKKWDWWVVGGRWSGFLKLKPGCSGETGKPGLMGSRFAEGADRADQARKGDIDFEGMRAEAGEEAGALWDKAAAITGGKSWDSWETVRERNGQNIQAALNEYHGQASVVALKSSKDEAFSWEIDDKLAGPRDVFVAAARDRACTTFALLHEGKWYEKGEMGWFACVSNEKDQGDWNREFNALLDSLPDDTQLTVVDCHI